MKFLVLLGVCLALVNISGCANLTTYNKSVALEDSSLSIDAKQRVITSRKLDYNSPLVVCAEPSPDALAVLGASGALTGSNTAGAGGSASSGLSESAASIGLRTQSIQLLRDFNYRICESYANGAINPETASALLRRGQSSMMGLIAIEQLTGPVVAAQASLSASASAGTGGPSGDVAAAQSALATAQEKHLTTQSEIDSAVTEHQANLNAVTKANSQLAAASAANPAEPSAVDAAKTSLDIAQSEAKLTADKLKDKRRREKVAAANVIQAKANLAKAERGITSAGATASSTLGEVARANAQSSAELAKQVRGIVEDINENYLYDTCFALLREHLKTSPDSSLSSTKIAKKPEMESALNAAFNVCSKLLSQ